MNTTTQTSATTTSKFGTLRSLGRGIAVASTVALMGVGTISAADANAAGISSGIRYSATDVAKPGPTALPTSGTTSVTVRSGSTRSV